jgi:hypothetical protein
MTPEEVDRCLGFLVSKMSEDQIRGYCIENAGFANWYSDWQANAKRQFLITALMAELADARAKVTQIEQQIASLER